MSTDLSFALKQPPITFVNHHRPEPGLSAISHRWRRNQIPHNEERALFHIAEKPRTLLWLLHLSQSLIDNDDYAVRPILSPATLPI